MFQMMKAFMKPEQAKQLEESIKIVLSTIAETHSLAKENNEMLKELLKKKGGK